MGIYTLLMLQLAKHLIHFKMRGQCEDPKNTRKRLLSSSGYIGEVGEHGETNALQIQKVSIQYPRKKLPEIYCVALLETEASKGTTPAINTHAF